MEELCCIMNVDEERTKGGLSRVVCVGGWGGWGGWVERDRRMHAGYLGVTMRSARVL